MATNANLTTLERQLQELKDSLEFQQDILELANSSVPPDNASRQVAESQIAFLNNEINQVQRAINQINFDNQTFVEPEPVATVEEGPPTVGAFYPGYIIETANNGTFQIVEVIDTEGTREVVASNFETFNDAFGYARQNDLDIIDAPSETVSPRFPENDDAQDAANASTAALEQARIQAQVREIRNANSLDWRVKLSLAPGANYLYNTPGNGSAGILEPLRTTQGVIFPYTPRIDTIYSANYSQMDLTHTNYRQYYYKGSNVQEVLLTADFTAQDTQEANTFWL